MSCPHGNHPDACDICDEVVAAYESGKSAERDRLTSEFVTEAQRFVQEAIASERDGCVVAGFYACVNSKDAVRVRDAIRARGTP